MGDLGQAVARLLRTFGTGSSTPPLGRCRHLRNRNWQPLASPWTSS
jgi:hypothetical protein